MEYERRLEAATNIILTANSQASHAPPDFKKFGVTATLKPHQVEGVSWLIHKYLLGVNVVLGDESNRRIEQMGLGKTLQAISFLSYLKFHQGLPGPFLVLCPLSVTDGWVSEINRFTPKLEVLRYVGDKDCRRELRKVMYDHVNKSSKGSLLPFDVLLTTYDIALVDQDFLSQIPWQYAVLYNVLLEQFLIPRRLLITGTPIQNNLTELWALMHFCMPLVFGTLDQFLSAFKETGESLSGLDASNVKETYKSLKFILGAFMLRRTKSLLIESGNLVLPPLTELTVMVPLVSLQKKIYTSILRKELPGLLALSSGASTHTSLQNIVIQLRKACSHPYLFPGIEPEPFEEGEHLVQASGKLLVLDQLLKRLHDIGHRVLLFSQMTSTLDILQDFMELRKYSYERLDGSVRAEERFAAIKSFSAKTERGLDSEADTSNAFVFMISTRAGGVGLNLVAADTVIFYEQDWNPQVDKQALQRAHRIGQISHVLSINLVSEHTVEEVILRRAERKLQLSHNVVGDTMEEKEEDRGDLRSLVFGLQRFDPEEQIHDEESDNLKLVEISSLAEKVVAIRQNVEPDKEARKFEINSSETLRGSSSSAANVYSELDEASYLSWVEKLKEASRLIKDEKVMELGNRKNVSEERHVRVEAARKKAEEKKVANWEANGYESLSVEEPIIPEDVDSSSDAGSVHFVYGDCTKPSTVSQEPAIIFSCVDDSGNWGRGGMFNALSKLSSTVPDAYHRASEFKDLHLGDLHLIKIDDNGEQQDTEERKPLWVALAVTQSYRPKRKVPRSSISIPDLERCLAKASFSASQKSASLHMPRIGYQDGSDRSQWYTVERLLRKYSSIFAVKIFVYYYRRSP
ncbi:SNF2 domain-containing protein / helicase domain-containing protein [Raphanus sativus]|nr:SNF2 domain-containing protein / helicase domain-containing protein [Raphanus sativus]